jgi:hypothetical protein
MVENYQRLLDCLADKTLQRVATAKMAGYTNGEIAADLGLSEVSIRRKVAAIRTIWTKEEDEP